MHLNEAAGLSRLDADCSPETMYAKLRIVEEIFHASPEYGPETHDRFISKRYAQQRIDSVLEGPVRKLPADMLYKTNTNILLVRDCDGNVAWGTHTINCPQVFGAGIVVDGAYVTYIMNADHAAGGTRTGFASGIWTTFALYDGGKPAFIAGSPGQAFFHGPYQVMTSMVEFGMSPIDAVRTPRFGFGAADTFYRVSLEAHCSDAVSDFLVRRGIDHQRISPAVSTGLVGAARIDQTGLAQIAQDPRRDGLVLAL
jgi:gamma-glutamyltranspeptidase